ncbi:Rpp20 subunit of nuclear RNase MRP and P-domain-containing protein [Bisporella sp. PMI_857]|nr:Rpp20 subunit of nuclear RNase MRP and P-domain-containing protein [Bisporella sp. PMI_857]
MAKEAPIKDINSVTAQHTKLPRLPDSQKIQKRPLIHPPIPSPHTGSSTPKIIYISASSPFIATVKRVRKLLSHIEARSGPSTLSSNLTSQIQAGIQQRRKKGEEVILKGTGKAIEKVLQLVVYWQAQQYVVVKVRTGSVGAVDDVVERGDEADGAEAVESRVRRTSCLEVGISLR